MKNSRNFIESIGRGFALLSAISESPTPLSLQELSSRTQFSKSTALRITYTLQNLGILERDPKTKKFRVGPKMILLGLSILKYLDPSKIALPHMQNAAKDMGETVCLAILVGTDVIFMETVRSKKVLHIELISGAQLPAHCSSAGKALLAFMNESDLDASLSKMKFIKHTPHTIVSIKDFRDELKVGRMRGFFINNEEMELGLRSVAAPIRNALGEVIAAINTVVPAGRVSEEMLETEFSKKIVETANRISSDLGYHPLVRKEA